MDKLKDTLSFSLKILFFILIPSSIGLMVLSAPITRVLFERGAFTAYSTRITSSALFFYAMGLIACGGIKVLVNTFYSLHDTMTPVKIAFASLVLNIILNVVLMWPLKVGGLALATSIAAAFNFIALYILLRKRLGDFGTRGIVNSFLKVAASGVVMALVLTASIYYIPRHNAPVLCADIGAGMIVFIASCYVLNVKELKDFLIWVTKKR